MIIAYLLPLANHLWQSTLCAGAVWLLAGALKKNRASVRYWLWLALSVKFLIPFSLLVSVGNQVHWRTAPPIARAQWPGVVEYASRPFAMATPVSQAVPVVLAGLLIGLWFWRFRCEHYFLASVLAAVTCGSPARDPADARLSNPCDVLSLAYSAGCVRHSQTGPAVA